MIKLVTLTQEQHDVCLSMLEAAKDQAIQDMNSEKPEPDSGLIYLMFTGIEQRFRDAVELPEKA